MTMNIRHNNHASTDAFCLACDRDEEEWLATHCLAPVQPGGEDPQHCGLERPCPRHDYRDPQPHWSVRNPVERASIMLGEARDV